MKNYTQLYLGASAHTRFSLPTTLNLSPKEHSFFTKVNSIVQSNLGDEQFDVNTLARKMHLSVSQLNRKLKAANHQSAGQLIRNTRMNHAATLLNQQLASVSDIAYEVGYVNPSHFSRSFKRYFGCSPSSYTKKYKHN